MDLLVSHLPLDDHTAKTTRDEAQQIRSQIIKVFSDAAAEKDFKADHWYYAKLAEAY